MRGASGGGEVLFLKKANKGEGQGKRARVRTREGGRKTGRISQDFRGG